MTFQTPVVITEDIPSSCAQKVIDGKADVGLVPVAILPQLDQYEIVSNFCIGANGPVGSVLLLSDVSITRIENILLDYQSRTSVMLARILAKELWKINPSWTDTSRDFENDIKGATAGVVIGDRALILKKNYRYVYDLSEEWKKLTGLPFVFACWVSRVNLHRDFIAEFNRALSIGLQKIENISRHHESLNESEVAHYLEECIDYKFDDEKKSAMELFFSFLGKISV